MLSLDLDVVARADGDVVLESAVERALVSVLEREVEVVELSLELDASVEIVMSALVLTASSWERRRRRPDNVRLKL